MTSLTFAVVAATFFFLAFATLRWIGILGLALLFFLFPKAIVTLLILAALAFYLLKLR